MTKSSYPTTLTPSQELRGSSNASGRGRNCGSPVRVNELLERRARLTPAKTAVICGLERYCYADVDDRARLIAGWLRDGGLHAGDRVAICLDNSIDAVAAVFGVLKAGGVF